MPLPPDEGDTCGIDGCTGTFQILPPQMFEATACYCAATLAPCSWCEGHELRCTDCGTLQADVEVTIEPLVSLDTDADSCKADDNMLRIAPDLHFPIGQVFEVPDEFNGTQRGTFYYRSTEGTLRGPFMNEAEADFMMRRRIPT